MDTPLDDEEAMAQAMGFSSFGQNKSQKRKYNPHADAIISSDSKTAQRAAKASATGSNSTPLGIPREKPDPAAANVDEIDLDEDEDENEDKHEDDNDGIALNPAGIPESSAAPALVRPHGLPERPVPGPGFIRPPGDHKGSHGHQDGSKHTVWYEGYYDPSSNENPWRRLEGSKGLPSLGTWIS
jgi:hypothetical protein